MKKTPSESGRFNPRIIAACIFFLMAGLLAFVSIAATPATGTLDPGGAAVTWSGFAAAAPVGVTAPDPATCQVGVNCDNFTLTLSGAPADWAGQKARVKISSTDTASDFDLYIHKGTSKTPTGVPLGARVGSSASDGSNEEVTLDPTQASIGTGSFTVQVVYFLVASGVKYNADESSISGDVVVGPTPTP